MGARRGATVRQYLAALVAAAVELAVAAGLVEPPRRSSAPDEPSALVNVVRRMADPVLSWLLLYVVAEVVMEHLVSELGQPYIAVTLGGGSDDFEKAGTVSGIVVAIVSIVAAAGAASTPRMRRRFGVVGTLLLLAVVQVGVLSSMAAATSVAVIPLLCLRSLQPAGARILVSAAAAPRVAAGQRATFLSHPGAGATPSARRCRLDLTWEVPMDVGGLLRDTAERAIRYLEALDERPVHASATLDDLRARLGGPMPDSPVDAAVVVAELAAGAEGGIVGTMSPRYFGFVIGGSHPAAIAADWLVSTWDQNAGLYVGGPAVGVMEEVAAAWLVELFGLPEETSVGFVTGCQMAHFTALAAARHHVLAEVGWDVEAQGLVAAPRVRVLVGAHRHATIDRALRYLGFGTANVEVVPADASARMDVDELGRMLASEPPGPTIVCAQVGEVNTGAIDPVGDISHVAHRHGAWVHVDGAFGMWAAASSNLRPLVAGLTHADSWATDAHKWLNVPYDSGLAFCAHPSAHVGAMSTSAAYLERDERSPREQMDWNPEFSRRARGVPVYAVLRSLGRAGVADLVEGCCRHARRFADGLRDRPGVEVLNDVVLNQVLVAFDGGVPADEVVRRVQNDGTCWLSGTTWQGRPALRISVCNWQTTEADVDRSVAAILRAARR